MTISLKSMRYFNTALAHGSIAQAADELNIAASAVSAAIDQVEAHFQLKLVNRFRSRGIFATASGKVIERKFACLLDDFEALLAEGAELKQAYRGELKIGYYAPIAPAFLPDVLISLTGPEFDVMFSLEECDNVQAQEGLLAGEYDAILFVSDGALPQVDYDMLIEAPAYCLMPENHALARQSAVTLQDLAEQNLVVLNRPVASDYYKKLFEHAGQTPKRIAYANSTEMVRSMVGVGHGVAVLNMLPATDISYSGHGLCARPIADVLPSLTLSLGYDKTNPRRIVSRLANELSTYFESEAGQAHVMPH
ncbi:LysR family transcriptional regulator [uncultured Ruegeria sp.]|uniref:LysR family transcriptional regulator n=1 Tax=uncultured Ruegeria sp. TaxID=259304 RepID=UPI0026246FA6|nr:LysR family transcriptional regulator [uncultured Ruegeria sp.]